MSAELEPIYEEDLVAPVAYTDEDVLRLGRCKSGGELMHLFFSDDEFEITRAKAICGRCVVKAACLDGALRREEPWGVWGGELFRDGKVVQFKRQGRPPRVPKVIEIDERII